LSARQRSSPRVAGSALGEEVPVGARREHLSFYEMVDGLCDLVGNPGDELNRDASR
jgi:hypothetical protein